MSILKTIIAITAINTTGKVAESTIKYASKAISDHNNKPKQKPKYIHVPQSSDYYIGKHYLEVQKELIAYGFENVHLLEKCDLKNNWLNKGRGEKVDKISINGKDTFRQKQKFHPDVQVVIEYHTYRN